MAKPKAFELIGEITVDPRKAVEGLKTVERQAKSTTSNISKLTTSIGGGGGLFSTISEGLKMLPGLGMVAGALTKIVGVMSSGVKMGFDYNRTLEEQTISFEVMLKSATKARDLIADLARKAEKSPFSFPEIIDAAKRMTAMGYSIGELSQRVLVFSDAAAGLGVPMEQIIRGLGQIRQRGKVSFEEINQLLDANIPFWEILGEQLAKTDKAFARLTSDERTAKLQKMVTAGQLSAKGVEQAITIGLKERYGGIGSRVASETASGLEANLSDVTARLLGTASGPTFERYKEVLRKILTQANSETIAGLARGVASGTGSAFSAIGNAVSVGQDITSGIIRGTSGAGLEAAGKFIGEFKEGIGANSPAKEFIPIGVMAAEGFQIGFAQGMKQGGGVMGLFTGGSAGARKGVARWDDLINRIAAEVGVDANLIRAVMMQESGGNPRATSHAGARGLMQLMPGTARRYGVTSIFNPEQNITAGATYLRDLLKMFGGRTDLALAGYNWGENRRSLRRAHETGQSVFDYPLPGETRAYVKLVEQNYARLQRGGGQLDTPVPVRVVSGGERVDFTKEPIYENGQVVGYEARDPRDFSDRMAGHIEDLGFGATGDAIASLEEPIQQTFGPLAEGLILEPLQQVPGVVAEINEELQQTEPILMATGGAAERLRTLMGELKESSKLDWMDIAESGQGIFAQFFMDLQDGWKGALANMGLAFARSLQEMAAQALASQVWGFILNLAGSAFGGALGGGNAGTSALGFIPGRAVGGPVMPGGAYLVGERGPELLLMGNRGGNVVPNNQLNGNVTHVHNWYVNAPMGAQSLLSRETQAQVERRMARAAQRGAIRSRT